MYNYAKHLPIPIDLRESFFVCLIVHTAIIDLFKRVRLGTATKHTMSSDSIPTIKKRSRPQPRVRETSLERGDATQQGDEEQPMLPCVNAFFMFKVQLNGRISPNSLADLLELRKLRKARQGIDVSKLNKGDLKKKRKRPKEGDQGGLKQGAPVHEDEE